MFPTARHVSRAPSPLDQSRSSSSPSAPRRATREITLKPEVGTALAGKYRLERVLGEGGMSTVFAAINLVTGKQVAIKWLRPEVLQDQAPSQQLLREAQAASAVDHPNVVNVFDVGWHQGALFLVMELLHGEPLSELLARESLVPSALVRLLMPVLRGVHAAHRMGVVHRDLKPDNIFLCRDPHGGAREPKVLDFGISKLGDDGGAPGGEPSQAGTVFGTPQYMAPEQLRDARLADGRSDVYALGAIFYRALSHEYPYDADTLTALTLQVLGGDAPPLAELCPELERGLCAVIMRALALNPAQRFQSVAEFAQALEPYGEGVQFVPADQNDGAPRSWNAHGERESTPPPRHGRVATAGEHGSARLGGSSRPRASAALEVVLDDTLATLPPRASSLRRTLLSGVALFALGSFAPIGWHLWHSARGASNTISAISTKVGSGRARPEPVQAPARHAVPADALPARESGSGQLEDARAAVEARGPARERNLGEARGPARERNVGEARGPARERNVGEARAGARERNVGEVRAGARERNAREPSSQAPADAARRANVAARAGGASPARPALARHAGAVRARAPLAGHAKAGRASTPDHPADASTTSAQSGADDATRSPVVDAEHESEEARAPASTSADAPHDDPYLQLVEPSATSPTSP